MLKRTVVLTILLGLVAAPAFAEDGHTSVTFVPEKAANGDTPYIIAGGNDTAAEPRSPGYHGAVKTQSLGKGIPPTVPEYPVVFYNCASGSGVTNVQVVSTGQYDICVLPPSTLTPTDPKKQVNDFVANYYRKIPVNQPAPEISAKNGGICGVLHSLDLHMDPEMNFSDATDFGQLNMHVYGRTTVNWGDSKQDTYTDAGAPFPNSDIEHSWDSAGTYNITATTTWVADYTVGPYNGTTYNGLLTGVTTSGSIPNFNVVQAQAVIQE